MVELARVSARDAREEVLDRTRRALGGRAGGNPVTSAGARDRGPARAGSVERFCERVAEYRATVRRCDEEQVEEAVSEALSGLRVGRLVVPPDLPDRWRPRGGDLMVDRGLSAHQLDAVDGALTGCELAIAETGTIVLRSGGAAQGRRALTLVPDVHLCVVGEGQVVESVPEAIAALEPVTREPLTFISGPSATSDIELSRVEGVHGPRTLHLLVVAGG